MDPTESVVYMAFSAKPKASIGPFLSNCTLLSRTDRTSITYIELQGTENFSYEGKSVLYGNTVYL